MVLKKLEKSLFIETNKKIVKEWQEKYHDTLDVFGVRDDELDTVLEIIEKSGTDKDPNEDLIIKSAYIMGVTSWAQPFLAGNKRTGILVSATFLHDNGFDIEITKKDESYLRRILYTIQDTRSELDSSIISELILYISKRIG